MQKHVVNSPPATPPPGFLEAGFYMSMTFAVSVGLAVLVALAFAKAIFFPTWRTLAREARAGGATFYVSGGPEIYFYRSSGGQLESAHGEYWPELKRYGWSPEPDHLVWVKCEKPLPLPQKSLRWVS